jgi:DedD protein
MGLFSNKNKRDRAAEDSGRFYSKDDDAAIGERARSKRASNAGATAGAGNRRTANDPMLPEKKRARRRLVGAIALALGAAIGLPMLLDSSPKPLAGDIAIDIPAKDKAPALPVPAAPAASSASGSASVSLPAEPAATAPAARDRTVTAAESVDKGEEVIAAPPPPSHKSEAHKPEPKPQAVAEQPRAEHKEAKPEHKESPKLEHKEAKAERLADRTEKTEKPAKPKLEDKPVKPHEDARALAILEGKPAEPKPDAASSQKSVLQVAAMSSADKAAEVQARLRAAGISSFTEKTPSGLIRVKVGPLSKDDADKVHAKLAKLGL